MSFPQESFNQPLQTEIIHLATPIGIFLWLLHIVCLIYSFICLLLDSSHGGVSSMRSGTLLVSSNALHVLSRIVSGVRLVLSEYICTKCIWTNESAWWLSCASSGDGCACVSTSVHICTYMYTCIFAYHSRYWHWFLSAYAHCVIATNLEWNQPIYILEQCWLP